MAKRRAGSPSARASPASNTAFILGLTCGVALGALATFTLFSWLPELPQLPDTAHHITTEGFKPSEKESTQQLLADSGTKLSRKTIVDPADIIQTAAGRNVETPTAVKPVENQAAHFEEGTRLISDLERYGGWRLTPEVLEIAKKYPRAEIISVKDPVIILLRGFLSVNETEHMVELASTHMARSKVVADVSKKKDDAVSKVRTSYGAWLSHNWRDSLVQDIEKRIHNAVGIPREFGEGIYVLRYEKDQKYDPHTDNCGKKGEDPRKACLDFLKRAKGPSCGHLFGGASCGDRIATVVMYLRSPDLGGETVFPNAAISKQRLAANGKASTSQEQSWYCKDPAVLKVAGQPGDAVLFWDYVPRTDIDNHIRYPRFGSHENKTMDTEAANDPTALHGGCPVTQGEKWIATRWIRSSKFV